MCFILDRSISSQMGKPHTIREECGALLPPRFSSRKHCLCSFIVRNATQWSKTAVAVPSDAGLAAYVVRHPPSAVRQRSDMHAVQELQRILSRSLDFLYSGMHSASGLQTDCDYLLVIKTVEGQLYAWENEWATFARSAASGRV